MSRAKKIDLRTDEDRYILFGSLLVFFLVLIVIGWGFWAKVDTFVVAPGKVVVESFKKPIQYKDWGTVSKIFVKEGMIVQKGQPLIELEKLEQNTNYQVTLRNYYSLLAERDRLLSEKNMLKELKFSSEILKLKDDELKDKLISSQRELFKKRKQALEEELAVLNSREKELMKRLKGVKSVLEEKRKLAADYEEEIKEQEDLVKEGLTTKYRLNDLKRNLKALKAEIKGLESQLNELESSIEEVRRQKNLKITSYLRDVSQRLTEVEAKISELKPKLKYAKEKVKKTLILAPTSGQVIGLKVYSKGEVVKPGDTIMFIVPQETKLFILAKVSPNDREKVKKGQMVDLRFPSFINLTTNVVEGKVTYISEDTLSEPPPAKGEYYEAHIKITEKGWKQLKDYGLHLISGMPAVAYIKAEKVSPIEYVLQPVIILVKSAFRAN